MRIIFLSILMWTLAFSSSNHVSLSYFVKVNNQYLLRIWNSSDNTTYDVLSLNEKEFPIFEKRAIAPWSADQDFINAIHLSTSKVKDPYGTMSPAICPPLAFVLPNKEKKQIDTERNQSEIVTLFLKENYLLIANSNWGNISVYNVNTFKRVLYIPEAEYAFWLNQSENLSSNKYKNIQNFKDKLQNKGSVSFESVEHQVDQEFNSFLTIKIKDGKFIANCFVLNKVGTDGYRYPVQFNNVSIEDNKIILNHKHWKINGEVSNNVIKLYDSENKMLIAMPMK